MKYKIVIWCWREIKDFYESEDLQDVRDWFLRNWYTSYDNGFCAFDVYEGDRQLSFEEEYDLGFYG